jgi:hypothetical protein
MLFSEEMLVKKSIFVQNFLSNHFFFILGYTDAGKNLTNNIANYNADVIIIGGDVAYDDGLATCYYSWDTFL